jgi:tetratricopeptide (TPR) repeat protein
MLNIGQYWSQSELELFEKANDAYSNEEYDSAFALYEKIESSEFYSTELFQNMGTAAYKKGDIPNAVYYYEKGLKLNPGNKDLEHNLSLANKEVVDKIKSKDKGGFSAWLSHLIGNTADYWASWTVILSITGGVFMISTLILKQKIIKKTGIYLGVTAWTVAILFIIFSFVQGKYLDSKDYGIVFTPSVDIKNEPSQVSSTAFVLHEGTKVKILDITDEWCKVAFNEDKIGWISLSQIKVI